MRFFLHSFLHSTGDTKSPYSEGIAKATNDAKVLAIDDLNTRNAKQSDLEATFDNIAAFPLNYVHLLKKSPEQVVNGFEGIVHGLNDGKDLSDSLKLATNNAVTALQYAFAVDISQVLTGKLIKYKKVIHKFIPIHFHRWQRSK